MAAASPSGSLAGGSRATRVAAAAASLASGASAAAPAAAPTAAAAAASAAAAAPAGAVVSSATTVSAAATAAAAAATRQSATSGATLGSVDLRGKVAFITGGSRGIGRAIALMLARHGARGVALVAKTSDPNPKLPGTIHSVAAEVEAIAGKGTALPVATDIRDGDAVEAAVAATVEKFGGVDILVNNASAIWLKGLEETDLKRYDLMNQINARGTYACTRACIPHLKASAAAGRNPHILTLAPPPNMSPAWISKFTAYSMAKYGMSMCVLGHSGEFFDDKIAVNGLWPRTGIATAAVKFIAGDTSQDTCRTEEIMSDAAEAILTRPWSRELTGQFFIDDEVLLGAGVSEKELEKYLVKPGTPASDLMPDFFLDTMTPTPAKL